MRDTTIKPAYRFHRLLYDKTCVALVSGYGRFFVRKQSNPDKLEGVDMNATQFDLARRLLENEYACIRKVESEFVPRARDFYQHDREKYLILDYVPGVDLRQAMNTKSFDHRPNVPLNEEEAFRALLHAAKGVKDSHESGVMHHDIKPENILVQTRKKGFLIDFGAAKMIGRNYSEEGLDILNALGTPGYAAPEQHDHHPLIQTDSYMLGRTLYFVVTRPHMPDEPRTSSREYKPPYPAEEINPKLYKFPDLKDLLHQSLQKVPSERPSIDRIIDELAAHVNFFSRNTGKLLG